MEEPRLFAQMFTWFRGWFRARQLPRCPRFVPMVLEGLEDRCVTTVHFGLEGTLSFGPGHHEWATQKTPFLAQAAHGDTNPAAPIQQAPDRVRALDHHFSPGGHHPFGSMVPFFQAPIWPGVLDQGVSPVMDAPPSETGDAPPSDPSDPGSFAAGPIGISDTAPSLDQAPEAPASAGNGTGDVLAGAVSPASPVILHFTLPTHIAGLPASSTPSLVVAPTLATPPGDASPDGLAPILTQSFRITRTTVSDTALEVPYRLTTYSSAVTVSYESVAVLAPGSDHVDVPVELTPAGTAVGPEIVTLTLLDKDPNQGAPSSITLFLTENPQRCSEGALLQAYRQGNSEEAFRALVERHRPAVLRTCQRVLGSWDDAEDASQMVFVTLARRQVCVQGSLAGWLATVARNTALMFLRSRSRRSRHEQRAARPVQVASKEPAHDLHDELVTALTQIPARFREAVRLRYLEGLSQLEAAQVVGCPRGTLAQRAAQGVRWLRNILGHGSSRAGRD